MCQRRNESVRERLRKRHRICTNWAVVSSLFSRVQAHERCWRFQASLSCDRGMNASDSPPSEASDSNLFQRAWRNTLAYAVRSLWGIPCFRWRLHDFSSETEAIRKPLASGVPVLYVLSVRGCRYCEFTRRLFERAVNMPVLPIESQHAESSRVWLIGDALHVVWVDCGRSEAAERFCESRSPRTIPLVELALPRSPDGSIPAEGFSTVEFSRDTWDWSVIGLRAFLRACGVLPPPGLPPWLYERWRQSRRLQQTGQMDAHHHIE